MNITPMKADDHTEVFALWTAVMPQTLSADDEQASLARFLARNPGLSLVARSDGALVGAVLCGHDGRRGFLYHMAVSPAFRRSGVARSLAREALTRLGDEGIDKCHIFVETNNSAAQNAWSSMCWNRRDDLYVYAMSTGRKNRGMNE